METSKCWSVKEVFEAVISSRAYHSFKTWWGVQKAEEREGSNKEQRLEYF
jgi:hypothetical protein